MRGAYGLSGSVDLPISEELGQRWSAVVLHDVEWLLPPQPHIDVANPIRITMPTHRNFMRGGLTESKRREHRLLRITPDWPPTS